MSEAGRPSGNPLCARVSPELFEAARAASGLGEAASQGDVIRYALAVLAGLPDPAAAARRPASGNPDPHPPGRFRAGPGGNPKGRRRRPAAG